ncbi:alpha-fibrinogenase albofibrase-like [Convolutriloba macropyga]|uniref:alpha-fibrinogenase albofibrase-like n=1 Tax=Convolutriloba macropyga TaxID=536237 RepID=UPI003F521C5C
MICTEPVVEGGNICDYDIGGPLFEIDCNKKRPKCLYGVASYYLKDPSRPTEKCNGGSVFTRVFPYVDWMERIINLFENES